MPELLIVSIALITVSLVLSVGINLYADLVNKKLDKTLKELDKK